MTKSVDPDTLDPVPDDDYVVETPKDTMDPVPDRVGCDLKKPRRRRPSMKRKATSDAKR